MQEQLNSLVQTLYRTQSENPDNICAQRSNRTYQPNGHMDNS